MGHDLFQSKLSGHYITWFPGDLSSHKHLLLPKLEHRRLRLAGSDYCVGRESIELLLSIGASRWEATRNAISKAVRVACMPILNQMSVVGVVSIPGMMTGQILSGSDPSQVRCEV